MTRGRRSAFVLMLLAALAAPSSAAQDRKPYAGRLLADALQELRARGLPLVYSSAVVGPDLRVAAEPRSATARRQLDELLAPHGLGVREGPRGTLQIVRVSTPKRDRPGIRGASDAPPATTETTSPAVGEYREFVSVTDAAPVRRDRGVASESTLDREEFARVAGSVAEDPLRAFVVLPGVTAVDDFHSDLAVRGSPFRHTGLVVDGIPAHGLRHTAFGRATGGSLLMLSGLVVEGASLRRGAYPRRHGDWLGAEIDLSLRQGSRSQFLLHGAVGGTHAVLAAEGPLGKRELSGSARGSWLVSGRQSYLEWPPARATSSLTPFGFSDALAKVVFDVRPTEQLTLTAIRGVSTLDEDEEAGGQDELVGAVNRASALSVGWRSTIGPALVIRQQATLVSQQPSDGWALPEIDASRTRAMSYRVDVTRPIASGMLEAGGLVERISAHDTSARAALLRSGFAHLSWPVTPLLTVSPGLRVTSSSLADRPVVSRWVLGEWSLGRGWSVIGSTGASRQLPELAQMAGGKSHSVRAERAMHLEAGVEQRAASLRWQAVVFNRREADVIRSPDTLPRLVAGALILPVPGERAANALRGRSSGVELLVSRRRPLGLSATASYTYGRTRQHDEQRAESFWADFDRRHAFSALARYRFSPATTLEATFRAGSSFPISGYFTRSGERLLVGRARNEVRLPPYARLDLRADHRLRAFGRSFTLFVEALNVLNRANVGAAAGSVDLATGEALGFTERLLRRRVSSGVIFDF